MNWQLLCKLLGLLALLVGASMLVSLPWAFPVFGVAEEFELRGFLGILTSTFICLLVGLVLLHFGRNAPKVVLHKEALAVVGLGWILAGFLGALPYIFSGVERGPGQEMTSIDAVFESVSGFTTTGASVLSELEDPRMLPKCVLFWRCFTQWLGGMGIIVLFIALLGHQGVGGKALMQREVTGPLHERVTPRVRETAIAMWKIYVGFSFLLFLVYLLEGMSLFDAICHACTTFATGGFSTYNASIAHFQSRLIENTAIIFMLLSATNYALLYAVLFGTSKRRNRRLRDRLLLVFNDPEWRVFMGIILSITAMLTLNLWFSKSHHTLEQAFRSASFVTVSLISSTGFGTENFALWSEFAKGLLLMLMFIGGCAGSTAGGLKVIRLILFFKIIRLEIERAFKPKVIRSLRLGDDVISDKLRHDVVVYISLVLFLLITCCMILNALEPDRMWLESEQHTKAEKLVDCTSAVVSAFNNIGPGLGVVGPASNFAGFSAPGKILLILLMLLGRLELYAVLVLFFPSFWRNQ